MIFRYIKREQEYRRTIEELQNRVNSLSSIKNQNVKKDLENIKSTHHKILEGIQKLQRMTGKVLQHQKKGIEDIFSEKIKKIKKEIQEERDQKADTYF
jgi:hypothetical protein